MILENGMSRLLLKGESVFFLVFRWKPRIRVVSLLGKTVSRYWLRIGWNFQRSLRAGGKGTGQLRLVERPV